MRVSATEIASFRECRRKWDYSSGNRQSLEGDRPQQALWLGTAVHEALRAYYGSGTDLVDAFNAWTSSQLYDIREQNPAGLDIEVEAELYEAIDLGRGILNHYAEWAPLHDNWETVYVEEEFEVQIRSPHTGKLIDGAYIVGRFDGIIRDPKGGYWILEHKTRAHNPHPDFLLLDWQTAVYQYVAQRLIEEGRVEGIPQGSRLRGVLYNVLMKKVPRKPELLKNGKALSQNKQISTTYEVYLNAIKEHGFDTADYDEFLEMLAAKGNQFFFREWIVRTTPEIASTEVALYNIHNEMDYANNNDAIYHHPTEDCLWKCSFRDLCYAQNCGADEEMLKQARFRLSKPRGDVYPHPDRKEA